MENPTIFTSEAEHTDDLFRLNIEHTDSSKTEHTESLLRPKTTIPNLSYVRNRRYPRLTRLGKLTKALLRHRISLRKKNLLSLVKFPTAPYYGRTKIYKVPC